MCCAGVVVADVGRVARFGEQTVAGTPPASVRLVGFEQRHPVHTTLRATPRHSAPLRATPRHSAPTPSPVQHTIASARLRANPCHPSSCRRPCARAQLFSGEKLSDDERRQPRAAHSRARSQRHSAPHRRALQYVCAAHSHALTPSRPPPHHSVALRRNARADRSIVLCCVVRLRHRTEHDRRWYARAVWRSAVCPLLSTDPLRLSPSPTVTYLHRSGLDEAGVHAAVEQLAQQTPKA